MVEAARHPLPILTALHWQLTPTLQVETAGKHMTSAIIRQRFDFAAAHRLHAPSLSDDENRATFGRCNNPSGHGHNYRIETAFLTSPASSPPLTAAELESLVDRVLVDPFDHKHLNEDTEEFSTANGYNPSVENIARVFYDRLAPVAASELAGRASLHEVTVWETDRTCATYPSVQDR
ncbi:MAG: 6-pyruvoyl trahydropterin synthase family protein, partial [Phycisphaerales bacterium]